MMRNLTMLILIAFFIFMVQVNGFDDYFVTEDGKIFSVKLNRFIIQRLDEKGYLSVSLNQNGFKKYMKVHRVVALTYLSNPDNKPQVNHIDGNKQNNNVSNLEWVTGSENTIHAIKMGLRDKAHEKARVENQKLVLHTSTGVYYDSLKLACKALDINYGTARNYINKSKINKLDLCYV
jgi:hypothetical protein